MTLAIAALLLAATATSLEVHVPGPAGSLGGTLTLPGVGSAPFPAVVTLTGSGAHHRDGNRTPEHPYRPFRDIANALAACGIATLRLDDRGVGASAGDANAATAEDTAADAQAALRFLRARTDIDPRRVGLVGHSYGGEIAPMVAAGDPAVAALVLLAGPARPFRETMRYQHRYRIQNDPAIAAADRDAALAEAMRQQDANVAASTEAWRRSIQDRDPLPTARRLRMPVLILHGLTDRAVDPEDARMLERAVRESGNQRVELRLFPDVNHHFQRDPVGAREGYDRLPTQDLAPEVLATLCSWLGISLSGAQAPAPSLPSVTLPPPLARVLTDYEAAWQAKDAAALAALFTEDGFVLSSGTPPVRGRAQIEKHYVGHGGPLALRALAFATEGSLGYIIGGFARAKGEPDIGKFTLTLRKVGGRWMIMSDMDNGNASRRAENDRPAMGQVVFVCEHGSVKSVMAARWFNRLAVERKAPFRAISRGVAPDAAIPPGVAYNLAQDGFDVAGFIPQRLEKMDLAGSVQVVAIGIDSPLFAEAKDVPVTRWSDIPPASTEYAASRDAMRSRMEALLDSLSKR